MSTTTSQDSTASTAADGLHLRTETVTWRPDTAPYPTSSVRKTALFREAVDGWVLQHVRTVTVSQRAASECTIDIEPALEDLPRHVRASLPDGVEVVDGA